jgi:hypothetical protein
MKTSEGRAAMEELLQNPSPWLRYAISTAVIEWAPEKAIPRAGAVAARAS